MAAVMHRQAKADNDHQGNQHNQQLVEGETAFTGSIGPHSSHCLKPSNAGRSNGVKRDAKDALLDPTPINAATSPQKGAQPPPEHLGSCELFMPVVFRGAAIGAAMALVVQACGPTPLGAVVRGGIQSNAGSLPHLQISRCQDAVCAGR